MCLSCVPSRGEGGGHIANRTRITTCFAPCFRRRYTFRAANTETAKSPGGKETFQSPASIAASLGTSPHAHAPRPGVWTTPLRDSVSSA